MLIDAQTAPRPGIVRVFRGDKDVTGGLFRAWLPDQPGVDGPGEVYRYKRNAYGKYYWDPVTFEPAIEHFTGAVRWEQWA
jgi:hypothetical protein